MLSQLQGQTTDLKSLATSVSSAVAGRHLMVWSQNPAHQAAWVVSGVSGSLTPSSVGVSLINLGGNKLDPYVPVHVEVTTRPLGLEHRGHHDHRGSTNTTPPGQSQFIAGPYPGNPAPYGSYIGLVAANLPARASHITMTGAGPLAVKGAEGTTWVVAAPVHPGPGCVHDRGDPVRDAGTPRVDDGGALGPDPGRAVDRRRQGLRRLGPDHRRLVSTAPSTGEPATVDR